MLNKHVREWRANASPDNAQAVHGMPVSLQLVAQRLEEEKVVAMTKLVLKEIETSG